jgi:peptidoglycan-N-acetylglucosamine deacetylase
MHVVGLWPSGSAGVSDCPNMHTPLSTTAQQGRRAATRRRRVGAGVAILLIGVALAVILANSGGHPGQVRHDRGLQASGRPQPSHKAPPARPHATPASWQLIRENQAIDRLLERQQFITLAGPEGREIALTFDDGPGPYTPHLLDQLQRLHAAATFFEIGFMFRWFHASVSRELRMGDVIGDHTETHPHMTLLSPTAQQDQILAQTGSLHKYGGPFPRLWRPPYGSYNSKTLAILRRLHMLMVLWTVDTEDYVRPGVAVIVHRALAGARPGAIILMHDAGGNRTQTIAAMPPIVRALRARGYRLVTIPQLILDDPPLVAQSLPSHPAGD